MVAPIVLECYFYAQRVDVCAFWSRTDSQRGHAYELRTLEIVSMYAWNDQACVYVWNHWACMYLGQLHVNSCAPQRIEIPKRVHLSETLNRAFESCMFNASMLVMLLFQTLSEHTNLANPIPRNPDKEPPERDQRTWQAYMLSLNVWFVLSERRSNPLQGKRKSMPLTTCFLREPLEQHPGAWQEQPFNTCLCLPACFGFGGF